MAETLAINVVAKDTASGVLLQVEQNAERVRQRLAQTAAIGPQVARGAIEMEGGLARASNAMVHLGGHALGLNRQMISLVEGIGEFAIGSPWLVAVLAGVAALVLVYEKLTDKSKKLKEETDKAIEALWNASETGKKIKAHETASAIRKEIVEISDKLEQSRREKNTLGDAFGLSGKETAELQNRLAVLQASFREMANEHPLEDILVEPPKKARAEVDALGKELDAVLKKEAEAFLKYDAQHRPGASPMNMGPFRGPEAGNTLEGLNLDSARVGAATASTLDTISKAGKGTAVVFDEIALKTEAAATAMAGLNASYLESIPGFGQVAKVAAKAIGIIAKTEGTVAIAQGFVKVAQSLFPFNPAQLASGLGMIKHGTALAAMGGGGGGGGGGSAGSSAGVQQSQRTAADNGGGTVTVVFPKMWDKQSAELADFMADLVKEMGNRRLIVQQGA